MVGATAMVAQHAPVLQAGDGVLDPCAAPTMAPPGAIAADPVALKHGGDELRDATIAAVGEDASMCAAKRLDG